MLPRFRIVLLNNLCGPLQVATRRQGKNNGRKEMIRIIQQLLENLGRKREKRLSCLKVLRQGTYLIPYSDNFDKKAGKAFKEKKKSRRETTHIYECLGQRLLEGVRDRDLISNEVIHARKSFTRPRRVIIGLINGRNSSA